mmetsp:Transcript_75291/g.126700  ORF Transcript_75291/g.126700 Transcript_75291/m.126700 type:complete len:204 (+) Transcript_75291:607-1218(+)
MIPVCLVVISSALCIRLPCSSLQPAAVMHVRLESHKESCHQAQCRPEKLSIIPFKNLLLVIRIKGKICQIFPQIFDLSFVKVPIRPSLFHQLSAGSDPTVHQLALRQHVQRLGDEALDVVFEQSEVDPQGPMQKDHVFWVVALGQTQLVVEGLDLLLLRHDHISCILPNGFHSHCFSPVQPKHRHNQVFLRDQRIETHCHAAL